MTKVYTVKPTDFAAQMKALSRQDIILFYPHNCTTIYYMTAAFKTNHDYFDDTRGEQ
jgi:hypothetical protein